MNLLIDIILAVLAYLAASWAMAQILPGSPIVVIIGILAAVLVFASHIATRNAGRDL